MKKEWFKIDMSTPVPTINVFGYIGPYDEVNYADFKAAFADLESKHPECFMDINSGGGSTIDGFGMFDTVKASKMKVTCRTVAMAGSMGGILAISGVKHLINKNATFMTHKPTGGAYGESSKLTSMATLIDQMEEKAVAAFMAKTKQKEAIVRDWFKPGVDKWFTAKMCVELGIADGYIEGDEPANTTRIPETFSSQREAWEVYNKVTNPKTDTMKKPIIDVLNKFKAVHTLDENSNDAAFAAAVENTLALKDAEIKRLTDLANADKTARVTKAVQDALDAGKITAEERENTTAILNTNYEAGVAMLNKLPGREDVNSLLDRKDKGATAGSATGVEDRSKWTYDDWSQNDPQGLEEMEVKDKAKFKALCDAKVKEVQSKMSIGI